MRTFTVVELRAILDDHAKFLAGTGGLRANLRGADLRGADLQDANLRGADLQDANLRGAYLQDAYLRDANLRGAYLQDANFRDANLRGADLQDANLRDANLRGADLQDADLQDANLRGADLQDANLQDADLQDANLRGADLQDADLQGAKIDTTVTQIVPETGAFCGYKKLAGGDTALLSIPASAGRVGGLLGRKCRAESAQVLKIYTPSGTEHPESYTAASIHDSSFLYQVGHTVTPETWDASPTIECGGGIHFFLTHEEARRYV